MKPITFRSLARWAVLAAMPLMCLGNAALADDDGDEHEGRARTPAVALHPLYKQECAACHVAYPPGLLPAKSWQRLMGNLPRHFGTDASVDAATLKQISGWLNTHAGTASNSGRAMAEPPQDRITQSNWFLRQHDEIGASVWKRPAIKSASNCIACHTRADQGDFNERFVRIPR